MKTFTHLLNFSDTQNGDETAIEIRKWHDVNHFEALCLYCFNHEIIIENVSDEEFNAASEIMADYGQMDKNADSYFFWIDK